MAILKMEFDEEQTVWCPVVDFSGSSLETLGWENGTSDFAVTAYWYGFKHTRSNAAAQQSIPARLNQ